MNTLLNKKQMPRLISLMLAGIMLFSLLSSCIGQGEGTESPSSESDEPLTSGIPEGYGFELTAQYSVIRSEKASPEVRSLSIELKNKLCEIFGAEIGISEDWRDPDEGALEILIGSTNRPESSAEVDALGGEMRYSVSVSGKTVVIAAASDALIAYAVEYFLGILYFDSESGCAYLPSDLNHVSNIFNTLSLALDSKAQYSMVYPKGSTEASIGEYKKLQEGINSLIGSSTQIMVSDVGLYDSGEPEVILGATGHPESAEAIAQYGYDECGYSVIGNKIVIAGRTLPAVFYAAERFLELLRTCCAEGDLLLPYSEPVVWKYDGYPDIPVTGLALTSGYDCGDGAVTLLYSEGAQEDYEKLLKAEGYSEVSSRKAGGESHAVLESKEKGTRLFVSLGNFGIRITAEPFSLPTFPQQIEADPHTADLTLIQSALNYENTDENTNGMSYLLQLTDGSFVIWDGGFAADAPELYKLLKDRAPAGSTPHIRMWILTHLHGDHQGCFISFADKYSSSVKLDHIGMNIPSIYGDFEGESTYTNGKLQKAIEKFKGTKTIKLHSGMLLDLPGADIEVLFTHEDLGVMGLYSDKRNDQSAVTRIIAEKDSVLLPGDIEILAGDYLVGRYGEYLKSTYLQVAHHGSKKYPTCLDFYKFSSPSFCFFPGSQSRFNENKTTLENRYLVNLVGTQNIFVADGEDKAVKLN